MAYIGRTLVNIQPGTVNERRVVRAAMQNDVTISLVVMQEDVEKARALLENAAILSDGSAEYADHIRELRRLVMFTK